MTSKTYKQHPVHTSAQNLSELMRREELRSPRVVEDENFAFARDKIAGIVTTLRTLLRHTNPALISVPGLDSIQNALQHPINEVTQFLSDRNPGHLLNAASYLDANVVNQFWAFAARPADKGAADFIRQAEEAATQAINDVRTQRDQAQAELADVQRAVQELQARLDEALEQASKGRSEASAAVANLDLQFAEREKDRAEKFEASLSVLKDRMRTEHADVVIGARDAAADVARLRDDAAKLVGVIGDLGVTTNFGKIAGSEGAQANFWRWVTVALFMVGVGMAGFTFYKFHNVELTAATALQIGVRLLYAIAITAPAWYTARESARHRTIADAAKQTELELAALGPFIELLDKAKQDQIRERLTERYFGRPVEPHVVKGPVNAKELRAFVVDIVKALRQGKPDTA